MSLCLFDLDRTLVEGRTIERLAMRFSLQEDLEAAWVRSKEEPAADVTESARIMRLFTGMDVADFEEACGDFRLREGAEAAVAGLRAMGFRIGIASASYIQAAAPVREHLGLDFAVAAEPEVDDGRLTGHLQEPRFHGPCGAFVCKERVLQAYRGDGITLAVGDGHNDECMLQAADIGVALEPCPEEVRGAADVAIADLQNLPSIVQRRLIGALPRH